LQAAGAVCDTLIGSSQDKPGRDATPALESDEPALITLDRHSA
jgi:hypothetical protein